MEAVIYLDTHVLVWLYAGLLERFPTEVVTRLNSERLAVSPVVGLELEYLFEVGRITQPADAVLSDLRDRVGLEILDVSARSLFEAARPLSWTRDPFDRLIAAQALVHGHPLLTADRSLHRHLPLAVWI